MHHLSSNCCGYEGVKPNLNFCIIVQKLPFEPSIPTPFYISFHLLSLFPITMFILKFFDILRFSYFNLNHVKIISKRSLDRVIYYWHNYTYIINIKSPQNFWVFVQKLTFSSIVSPLFYLYYHLLSLFPITMYICKTLCAHLFILFHSFLNSYVISFQKSDRIINF